MPIKLLGGREILMWFCFAFRKVRPFNTLNYDRNLREKPPPTPRSTLGDIFRSFPCLKKPRRSHTAAAAAVPRPAHKLAAPPGPTRMLGTGPDLHGGDKKCPVGLLFLSAELIRRLLFALGSPNTCWRRADLFFFFFFLMK